MFTTKTLLLAALVSLIPSLAAAAPPACVIGAVNTQSNPHDIAAVCKAQEVQDSITKNCGNAQEAAQKYFSEVCKDAGVTVSATVQNDDSNSSSSNSSSSSSSSSSDDGMIPTGTSSATNEAQATRSSSSGSEANPSATGDAARVGLDVVGLMAVGLFGTLAVL
ncbi:unnamed protein product [Zymoseptoria tritici ST99CH_3D7]|uniref:Extracellular membrane protein CFEM domain-containing protein n=1 Tax=Zymoseptoria tritici (strain ST99CH_3D7) TaxID=1276538 RepID=A0A1X7S7V7_ZYMT9|nr:unnamed protein product [Zymoseptoria tritici ST99CH_3D7]